MSDFAPEPLLVRIDSDTSRLAPVRRQIEAFATAAGFDDRAVGEIGLCVNEAMANVIRHAYQGRLDQPVEVRVELDADTLRIRIRDWGAGVTPDLYVKANKDPLEAGGLGLVCMGRLMDKVTFTPQDQGMLLEMVRRKR